MALSFTNFVTGDSVSSSEIKSQLDSIEDFVNEDITSSDLTTSNGWLTRALIYKPEFYGSPNPRMLAVTGDIYHRKVRPDTPTKHTSTQCPTQQLTLSLALRSLSRSPETTRLCRYIVLFTLMSQAER